MSFLEKAEERIELAVGSVFARLSKAELQPVEITQAVRRAMDYAAQQIDLTRVLVPHRYLILVSGHDAGRISPAMLLSIKTEIAMHAAKQGYRLAGELTLKIEVDPKLPRGQVRVGSSASGNAVQWQAALLIDGKRIPLNRGTTTIGRDQSADVAIDDRGMSRIHFEVAWNDQGAALRDRGSTNGTFVDGIKVQEVALSSGNKISAGRSEFVFELIARESH